MIGIRWKEVIASRFFRVSVLIQGTRYSRVTFGVFSPIFIIIIILFLYFIFYRKESGAKKSLRVEIANTGWLLSQ